MPTTLTQIVAVFVGYARNALPPIAAMSKIDSREVVGTSFKAPSCDGLFMLRKIDKMRVQDLQGPHVACQHAMIND
uniref:Secreted protein n=1 Tax=Panagrellus redivivus TaxID=6233 RepID=A0A7E4VBY7_PANRE